MIGETDPSTVQSWIQLVTSMGVSGALVWYLVTQALPRMQTRYDEISKEQAKAYELRSEKQAEVFERQLQKQTDAFAEQIKLLVDQNKFVLDQHEKSIAALTLSQEKQLDRIIEKFARCPSPSVSLTPGDNK